MDQEIFQKFLPEKENLISILHTIQDNHPEHYISKEAIKEVGDFLKIPVNQIQSVVSFYSMFSSKPRGKYIIRLCESPPCFLKGSEKILEKLQKILGIEAGETTKDKMFTLELTSCLGICGNAPVMMINDDVYGDLNDEKIEKIIKSILGGQR